MSNINSSVIPAGFNRSYRGNRLKEGKNSMSKFITFLILLNVLLLTGCQLFGPRHIGARFFDENVVSDELKNGLFVMTEESYKDYAGFELLPMLIAIIQNNEIVILSLGDQIVYQSTELIRFDDNRYYRGQTQYIKVWIDLSFVGNILNVRIFTFAETRDFQFAFYSGLEDNIF